MKRLNNNSLFDKLLVPPLFGCILSVHDAFAERSKRSLFNYFVMLSIFIAFFFPTYDSLLKMQGIRFRKWNQIEFFSGDPLSNIAIFFNPYIDSIYFVVFYIFLVYFFFYKSIIVHFEKEMLPLSIVVVAMLGIPLRHGADITYSTLATTLALYLCIRYNSKYLYYIPIICISFLCHPYIVLILVPALISNWFFVHTRASLGFIFFGLYGIMTYLIFNGFDIPFNIMNSVYEENFNSFQNYTSSDTEWGSGGRNLGLKYTLFVTLICVQSFVSVLIVFLKNHSIFKHMSFSFMFLSAILLYNCYDFYTFRERTLVVLSISAVIVFCNAVSINSVTETIQKIFSATVICLFILSLLTFPQPRRHLFNNEGWDVSVVGGCLMPSIVSIVDMHDFGFSDQYLNLNASNWYRMRR